MKIDLIEGAADAARFTGLSRRKIYRLAELGLVPVVRKGTRLYFRKSELERSFRSCELTTSTSFGFDADRTNLSVATTASQLGTFNEH